MYQYIGIRGADTRRLPMVVQIPVRGAGPLQDHVRSALFEPVEETAVHPAALRAQNIRHHVDAGFARPRRSFAGNPRIGIRAAHHQVFHTTSDEQIDARRCSTMMCAGFEVHVHDGIGRDGPIAECTQAFDLGMRTTARAVPALGQDPLAPREYRAHQRIRSHRTGAVPRQLKAAPHDLFLEHGREGKASAPRYFAAMDVRVATNTVRAVVDLYRRDLAEMYPEGEVRAMVRAVFQDRLGWGPVELMSRHDSALSESEILRVHLPLDRLRRGEPLQYVLGHTLFHGLHLEVGPSVLIPRPETEELVDLIIRSCRVPPRCIIDIGTGSGCIALALKQRFPTALVIGIDVSDGALAVASANAARNGLDVEWEQLDVLQEGIRLPAADLIVSNPPYVPLTELDTLAPNVRDHEPHLALFVDDADPLRFHRAIARHALNALDPDGALWFEGHHLNVLAGAEMLRELGFPRTTTAMDLGGLPRFIHARR